jgi:shikimate kinase
LNIFLIGMPGSGKSTVARHLAKAMHQTYIDLDGMIEKDAKMFIEDIFEKYGEAKFRSLETDALKKLPEDGAVIACGGGIVTVKSNQKFMNGITIYLDTDLEVIRERLKTDYVRPLLKQKSLETIHDERFLKYQDFADLIVSNHQDVEETVKLIIHSLEKRGIK